MSNKGTAESISIVLLIVLFCILANKDITSPFKPARKDETMLPDSTSISELLSELRSGLARDFFFSCGEESDSCRLLLQVAPGLWYRRMTYLGL